MILAPVLTLVTAIAVAQAPDAESLHKLFAQYYEDLLRESPETATAIGRNEYNDRWTDWSEAGRRRSRQMAQQYLSRLELATATKLPAQDRLSLELLRRQLKNQLEGEKVSDELLSVQQLFGLHNSVYSTFDQMPTRTLRDYENIVARLNAIPAYVDQHIAVQEQAIAEGLVQPKLIAGIVAKQIAAQAAQTSGETAILAPFRKMPASVSPPGQERLRRAASDAYEQKFLPAWRKLHAFFVNAYIPKARTSIAAGALPDGKNIYAMRVRHSTTTTMTPREIHELGLREVARIEDEMQNIVRELHFKGTLEEFEQHLTGKPANHFHNKEEMLIYCRNLAKLIEPEMPRFFRKLPRMPFGIRPIPEDREAASASHYSGPAADGSRAGFFYLKTYQPAQEIKHDKVALVLHETVPGHHLQIALQREIEGLPEFRKLYHVGAYTEGWALYAEQLGLEMGVYPDAYSRFGQLHSERFRAVRLVVDTGMHALGWSRDQAVAYFRKHAPAESLSEIDRYIAWPGQALSYKIGQLKISELRRRSERELGTKFDVREFHDVVLRNGPLPLDILEQQVVSWIAGRKTGGGS
ncbi:MAG: DUF885 domain-containing protein [Acidobacteria bacterium]|nr:DUF885 domain-containing protein [Acidobacteriota bacterium]